MPMLRTVVACALACWAFLLSSTPAHADQYRDTNYGFTIDLPPGWKRIPDADVKKLETEGRKHAPTQPGVVCRFEAAFSRANPPRIGLPYILVQVTDMPMEQATYGVLAKALNAETLNDAVQSIPGKSSGAIRSINVGSSVVDAARNRYDAVMDTQVGSTAVRASVIGFFSRRGLVQLNMYTKAADGDNGRAELDSIMSTFHFDQGEQFVPAKGIGDGYAGSRLMGRMTFYLLLAALVLWGIRKAARR